jgi:tetrahydromethanopterin S-methyltransferase subunit G
VVERIDERFVRAEERAAERFVETNRQYEEANRRLDGVDRQLQRTNDRLDSLVRVLIAGNVSLTCGILAGFASIVALILTQL